MKVTSHRKAGFTLVEIMIVVAIIGLLAAIAIPNFVKARENSQKNVCISLLKQIDGAKASWAMDRKKTSTDVPVDTDLYGTDAYMRETPVCPGGGTYTIDQVDAKPTCDISSHTY